jgi:hypothetical protein
MAEKFLKIGLDFHGVINTNPSYFKDFTEYAEARGHRIYIITGGPAAKISSFLNAWGIRYTELFAILDYYAARGEVKFFSAGNPAVCKKTDINWVPEAYDLAMAQLEMLILTFFFGA